MALLLRNVYLVFLLLVFSTKVQAVELAKIFGSNMVLQRDMPIPIWGFGEAGEKVNVVFAKKTYKTIVDWEGKWMLKLDPKPAGGTYNLIVKGKNTIELQNILMGDVWLCGGQSNMEWPIKKNPYVEEISKAAKDKNLRLYTVPKQMEFQPLKDLHHAASWQECDSSSVLDFSAVAYFFAQQIRAETKIPVGLISANWGGTIVETWMSREALISFPEYAEKIKEFQSSEIKMTDLQEQVGIQFNAWFETMNQKEDAFKEGWFRGFTEGKEMNLPTNWEDAGLPDFDGIVWFSIDITLSEKFVKDEVLITLGDVDDLEETYINGIKIGSTNGFNKRRWYNVEKGILKPGKNNITVRAIDFGGTGGLNGIAHEIFLQNAKENIKIPLTGTWKYRVSMNKTSLPNQPPIMEGPNNPTFLYNGMIAPLVPMAIKGVIWYQGESNSKRAHQYQTLFPALIQNWRDKFRQVSLPFLYVQLANYMQPQTEPSDSRWAELREAQTLALKLPHTGMALAIDIGEANDVHPKNKQDVGKRLSLIALNKVYGQNNPYSSPMYQSYTIEDNKVRIKFDQVYKGLKIKSKYGYLQGFSIAGEDQKFHWAKAELVGKDEVIVYCDKVENPVAIRYAWADNPNDANLYNSADLPASPFRTDSWKGLTEVE